METLTRIVLGKTIENHQMWVLETLFRTKRIFCRSCAPRTCSQCEKTDYIMQLLSVLRIYDRHQHFLQHFTVIRRVPPLLIFSYTVRYSIQNLLVQSQYCSKFIKVKRNYTPFSLTSRKF